MAPLRFLDYIYLTFFIIHIPIMFLVDLYPFWPTSIRPELLDTIREFYIETYADTFFTFPPKWFTSYLYMELLYHIPLSTWMIPSILSSHPLVPLNLLVFAIQAGLTTLTCIVDIAENPVYSVEQRWGLYGIYGGYAGFAVIAGIDNFRRVASQVIRAEKMNGNNKRR